MNLKKWKEMEKRKFIKKMLHSDSFIEIVMLERFLFKLSCIVIFVWWVCFFIIKWILS